MKSMPQLRCTLRYRAQRNSGTYTRDSDFARALTDPDSRLLTWIMSGEDDVDVDGDVEFTEPPPVVLEQEEQVDATEEDAVALNEITDVDFHELDLP